MVWAESETEALNDAKLWFQVQHDLGQLWIDEEAHRMGSDPEAGDLGMAESNEAVNHEHRSPQREILSTKFRVEPEHLRRSTRLLRQSDRPAWQRLREHCECEGSIPRTPRSPISRCTSPIRNTKCGSSCAGSAHNPRVLDGVRHAQRARREVVMGPGRCLADGRGDPGCRTT